MSDFNAKNEDSTNTSENTLFQETKWTIDHEKIFIEWGDKAMCYRWLHARSHDWFSFMNGLYTIPVIVISTLTGTANFAQTRVPVDYQNYYAMAVGGLNIIAGIISTIQQFLKITQLNEAHRVSSIVWDKFYRNIKIELAKHPDERIHVFQMIKMCKEEFDRLMETSPSIPEYVVIEFKKTFKDVLSTSDTSKIIVQPEICDKLIPTRESINQWNDATKMLIEIDNNDKKTKDNETSKLKTLEENKKLLQDWIGLFFVHNKRRPTDEEILDQLKEKIELNILKSIIQDNKKDFSNNV